VPQDFLGLAIQGRDRKLLGFFGHLHSVTIGVGAGKKFFDLLQ
jgi:hypothetical protein